MKSILLFILFIPNLILSNEYRTKLDSALRFESAADKYIGELEKKINNESMAYYGVFCFMKSNHANFPFTKLKYFYRGKKFLEKAILIYPQNIEYVYYRYEVQIKIPKGLGYNNLTEDFKKLKQYLANKDNYKLDPKLYNQISKIIS